MLEAELLLSSRLRPSLPRASPILPIGTTIHMGSQLDTSIPPSIPLFHEGLKERVSKCFDFLLRNLSQIHLGLHCTALVQASTFSCLQYLLPLFGWSSSHYQVYMYSSFIFLLLKKKNLLCVLPPPNNLLYLVSKPIAPSRLFHLIFLEVRCRHTRRPSRFVPRRHCTWFLSAWVHLPSNTQEVIITSPSGHDSRALSNPPQADLLSPSTVPPSTLYIYLYDNTSQTTSN